VLLADIPVEHIEPEAEVQRQPLDRPAILRVDAEIGHPVSRDVRRRSLGDAHRNAVPERVGCAAAATAEQRIAHPLLDMYAGLELVRPRDVRDGEALRVPISLIRMSGQLRAAAVADAEPLVGDRHVMPFDTGHQELVEMRDRPSGGRFEQKPAGDRRIPVELKQLVRLEVIRQRCFL
jgi:hypothetical protein